MKKRYHSQQYFQSLAFLRFPHLRKRSSAAGGVSQLQYRGRTERAVFPLPPANGLQPWAASTLEEHNGSFNTAVSAPRFYQISAIKLISRE
jgi:hypothetical protein